MVGKTRILLYTSTESTLSNKLDLNPSVWEYQSAVLGYNYHTARQSGAATVRYISYHPVITTYHPVVESLCLFCDIIIAANGIVYQWNKEPNKEMSIQNTPIQHLNQLNLTRKLLILYTVTLQVTNTIV